MKKIVSSLFILLLLIVLLWGAAGWYFGANAHSELKHYLTHSALIPGEKLFRAEMIDFKKTAFGAKARLKIYSDTRFLNETLGDIDLQARILNGPLFIDEQSPFDHRLHTGTTRWHLSIDQTSLDASQKDILNTLFPDQLPTATIVIDFDRQAHYEICLHSYLGKALIRGIYNLNTDENRGSVKLDNVVLTGLSLRFKIPQASIEYQHQKNITAAFKPGTTRLFIPELQLDHTKLKQPLIVQLNGDMALQTSHSNQQDFLTALVKMHVTQKKPPQKSGMFPVDEADLRLVINNLSLDGLIAVSETRAELDNLRQQIQWTLEEKGELPEGQDQIWQLNEQLQQRQDQLPVLISQKLFSANPAGGSSEKPGVNMAITAGDSNLSGHLSMNSPIEIRTATSLQTLLQGQAEVKLGKKLFDTVKKYLSPSQKQRLITPSFTLRLENGTISIH